MFLLHSTTQLPYMVIAAFQQEKTHPVQDALCIMLVCPRDEQVDEG